MPASTPVTQTPVTSGPRGRRRLPVVLIAVLALFLALGGPSYAGKQITGKQIKNNSVTGKDIKNKSVTAKDLKPDVVTAHGVPAKRVVATNGSSSSTAQANAPEVTLFSVGPLSVYGKCWHDTTANETHYGTFIKSATAGSIFDSRDDELEGGSSTSDFLNPNTDENERELEGTSAGANSSEMDSEDESDFTAFAKDGTTLRGFTGGAVKNGTVAAGNGPFGSGNVCLFTGGYFTG